MGSAVISEVLNDIPPWSSMIDSRSHHSGHVSYDISASYRSTTPAAAAAPQLQSHRRTASQSSRSATQSIQFSETAPRSTTRSSAAKDASAHQSINSSSASPPPAHETRSTSPKSPRLSATLTPRQHMSSTSPNTRPGPDSGSQSESSTSSPQAPGSSSSPIRIKVRDLQHIQSFAVDGASSAAASSAGSETGNTASPQYEISEMPIGDIIEMVAGLLTKITATNDQHYEHLHRQIPPPEAAANMSSQTSSVLAFHGKNVPSITILSYLSRIHKYCPATWEVFLSLLVYFDRMTERVNSGPIQSLRQADEEFMQQSTRGSRVSMADQKHQSEPEESSAIKFRTTPSSIEHATVSEDAMGAEANLSHFFVVDSFNIHRLVIAGVTCAAKYFSDIFFTNSRYAKVGGLPLVELNNLELQFLVLNDFRLAVPVEELEAYATMLVEFYAREIVAQRQSDNSEGIEMVTR